MHTAAYAMTSSALMPTPTARWWEFVREGRIFCGPKPQGHHIPSRFHVTEAGFIQCEAPALPQPLLDLRRARESRQFAEADRLERELRGHGMLDVPSLDELRTMASKAPMCGRWVFLLAIRGGGLIVAEIQPDERKAMKHLSTPAELIEYLGVFPKR